MSAAAEKGSIAARDRLTRSLLIAAIAIAAVLILIYLLVLRDQTILFVSNTVILVALIYDTVRGQRRRVAARLEGERRLTERLEERIEQAQGKSQEKN